jgi:hypothetical protein
VKLRRGDLLLACSDGILESFNEAEQEFGNMRLQTELRRAQGGLGRVGIVFSAGRSTGLRGSAPTHRRHDTRRCKEQR